MRLPDEVQKCVVFVGQNVIDEQTGVERASYGGTAFFVEAPSHIDGANFIYLVTAKHVARHIEDGKFLIRANTSDGKSEIFTVDAGVGHRWWYHPTDESVDVAVMPWSPPDSVDYLKIPVRMFLDPEKMEGKDIGVGDEVYTTGLFRMMTGSKRNLPIVRTGNIAMLPSERVPITNWVTPDIEAYLIECRSIGGLSGSPVFAQRSIKVQKIEVSGREPLAAGALFLMGLMHGHWDLPDDSHVVSWTDQWKTRERINMGVAMVIPAHQILEVLTQPDLKNRELEAEHELSNRHSGVLEGGSPERVSPENEAEATRVLTVAVSGKPYDPRVG